MKEFDYYFITDSNLTRKGIYEDVKNALKAGVKIIQYREKNKNTREMYKEAWTLRELTKHKAMLIINDRVDIALSIDADGVHLGNEDMHFDTARSILGNKIIGLTVHNVNEAVNAEKIGADYIGVSPIFETKTKNDAGKPAGVNLIKEIRKKVRLPIVAVGGITLDNMEEVLGAGADSVAMISAVVTKEDVYEECKKIRSIIKKHRK